MATVREILATKGATVWSVDSNSSVLAAAQFMRDHKIGGLVVTEEGRFSGMFTERDLLQRVVAETRDPAQTSISSVMTREVVCCGPGMLVEEARAVMRDRRIRHLPVLDEAGQLLGLVSIGDLNAFALAHQEQTIFMLNEYLYGRV